MTAYGITPAGFVLKRLEDIKAEMEAALQSAFGSDIDLSPSSVFGQIVGIMSYAFAVKWETAKDVHDSFDPDKAEGASLDAVSALTGIRRLSATATLARASVIGYPGTVVPAGAQASNEDTGDIYSLDEEVEISVDNALQAWVLVESIADDNDYTITLDGTSYTINSGSGATALSILTALRASINAGSIADAEFDGDALKVTSVGDYIAVTLSVNLAISQVGSPGQFTANDTGPLLLPIGKLSEIETPYSGWDAVYNLEAGDTGRNRETDAELRVRRAKSIDLAARNTADSIYSNLSTLDNVRDVLVLQNNATETDPNGIPPQHLWIIVLGGEDQEIAETIYATIPGGIGMMGNETVSVESAVTGQAYNIKFDRPEVVQAYISMNIEITSSDFPSNGTDQIKDALVAYGAENQRISEPLLYNKLFVPIYSIPGHEVTALYLGAAADPTGEVTLSADVDQIIDISADRIEVTIV